MVSVKLILIGAIAVTFLLIYVYIYFFGRQQTLRLLVFFKETKISLLRIPPQTQVTIPRRIIKINQKKNSNNNSQK